MRAFERFGAFGVVLTLGCADAAPPSEPPPAAASGGSAGQPAGSGGSEIVHGGGLGTSSGTNAGGGATAGVGGTTAGGAENGGGAAGSGGAKALRLFDTAVELERSTITQHAYSAIGVQERDYAYAGAMGGRAVTYLGVQYVVYYEADGTVTTARREVQAVPMQWQLSSLSGYRVTTDDRHNKMAIAISRGDGRLHLAFDHHVANELHYAHSQVGFASS